MCNVLIKNFIKLINKIYTNQFIISIVLFFSILIIGFLGNYFSVYPVYDAKTNQIMHIGFWESVLNTLSYFGLNVPEIINPSTILAFFLTYLLLFGNFLFFIFRNKFDMFFAKNLMRDKNIVIFGLGDINKKFLENLKEYFEKNDKQNVIVIDKEEKDFDEFWEKGYVFLRKEINDEFIDKLNFENTSNIIIALGDDRVNMNIGMKLIDKLININNEIKLIVHINDKDLSEIFFEKLENEYSNDEKKINLKTFSFDTEVVDDLFENYTTKLVPCEYAKLNSKKIKLNLAVIGNSGVSIELIKRIFINFIFPNEVKIKIFLIDENEREFLKKVKFETNYTSDKFPHIVLQEKKLDFDLIKNKNFWIQDDLVDVFIAFEDENKNLEIAIDLFEKVFIYQDKNKLKYPNIFFAMYEEFKFSNYINKNKSKFKNFYTFGNLEEVLTAKNLLDDEKFEVAMQIHNSWAKKKDVKKAWYSTTYTNRESSIAQYEHIPFKLLSLGYKICKENCEDKKDLKDEYEKIINKINKGKISFEEFLDSGDFYTICNTEHRRWMAYHFINNWEYEDYEGKDLKEKDYKKSLKLHHCLTDFHNFKYPNIKTYFLNDFDAYKKIPEYLDGKYKIVKIKDEK